MKNNQRLQRRIIRGRSNINGNADRPRLALNFSSKFVSAQLVDDVKGQTIVGARSSGKGNLTDQAAELGKAFADMAKKAGVNAASLDRRGRRYKQRLSAFVEAARKQGLEI